LFAISTLFTLFSYAWYNIQFVQHQGRYLFTALIPIGLAFAVGWDGALRPSHGRLLAAALVAFGFGLAAWGMFTGHGLLKWSLAIVGIAAFGLLIADVGQSILQSRTSQIAERPNGHARNYGARSLQSAICNLQFAIHNLLFVLPFAALPLLSLYALFKAIVPQLR
jgi:hypothetical protein